MIMSNVSDKLLEAGISIGYGGHSTINYTKLLSAVKEIAQQSFEAGENYISWCERGGKEEPDKEQFIKQLFGEEEK
jgi:hypothetical protein